MPNLSYETRWGIMAEIGGRGKMLDGRGNWADGSGQNGGFRGLRRGAASPSVAVVWQGVSWDGDSEARWSQSLYRRSAAE